MNTLSMTRNPFLCSLFMAVALCSAGAGCGQGELDDYGSVIQGLTKRSAGFYGTTSGTLEGTGSNQETPIKKIISYADSSYIYGLKVVWGINNEKMYGHTNGLEASELDFDDEPVKEIKYHVDASGYMRGIRPKTPSGTVLPTGYLNVTQLTAFSASNAVFTDLETYKGTISGVVTIWGMKFHYTTP